MTRFAALCFGLGCLRGLALLACGPSWGASDTKGATDAVHLEATALELCRVDSGSCNAGQVRALERAAWCLNASMLARHGANIDAGTCVP